MGKGNVKTVAGVAADSGGGVSLQTVDNELACCSSIPAASSKLGDESKATGSSSSSGGGGGGGGCTSVTLKGYTYTMPESLFNVGAYDDDDDDDNDKIANQQAGATNNGDAYGRGGSPELPSLEQAAMLRFAAPQPACLLFEFTFFDPATQREVNDLVKYLGGKF